MEDLNGDTYKEDAGPCDEPGPSDTVRGTDDAAPDSRAPSETPQDAAYSALPRAAGHPSPRSGMHLKHTVGEPIAMLWLKTMGERTVVYEHRAPGTEEGLPVYTIIMDVWYEPERIQATPSCIFKAGEDHRAFRYDILTGRWRTNGYLQELYDMFSAQGGASALIRALSFCLAKHPYAMQEDRVVPWLKSQAPMIALADALGGSNEFTIWFDTESSLRLYSLLLPADPKRTGGAIGWNGDAYVLYRFVSAPMRFQIEGALCGDLPQGYQTYFEAMKDEEKEAGKARAYEKIPQAFWRQICTIPDLETAKKIANSMWDHNNCDKLICTVPLSGDTYGEWIVSEGRPPSYRDMEGKKKEWGDLTPSEQEEVGAFEDFLDDPLPS